jgi:hypothetical protein
MSVATVFVDIPLLPCEDFLLSNPALRRAPSVRSVANLWRPSPRVMAPIRVLLLVSLPWATVSCGGGGSASTPGPPSGSLSVTVTPSSVVLLPNSSVVVDVNVQASNISPTPTVTLSNLPSGLTTTTTFPLSVPANGASIKLQASANAASGQYTLTLAGQAGSATTSIQISVTVQTTPLPAFYFLVPLFSEVQIPIGGSGTYQFSTGFNSTSAPTYLVALSINGLPPGTTATFNPSTILPGQSGTVTITATSTAATSQNAEITLIGTPLAPVSASSSLLLVDVSPKPGSLLENRTDYLSTEATPYAAVYDRAHKLIFSSNNPWNRIDVISATTHAVVRIIPIPDPHGVDMAIDNSRVWVATGSQQIFEIDPVSFGVKRHLLPVYSGIGLGSQAWEGRQLYALSDGTVLLNFSHAVGDGSVYLAIWDPSSDTMTALPQPSTFALPGIILRSGDGRRVYSIADNSSGNSFFYDVPSKTVSGVVQLGGYALEAAVNYDSSRIAVYDASGLNMLNGNLTQIGPLPGGGFPGAIFSGGMVFNPTTGNLFEVCMPLGTPVIYTIDSNSLNVIGIAPAMPMIPVMTELSPPFYMPEPFAVDDTGIVLGIEDYGIAFDDSTFFQNFVTNQPGSPTFLQHMSPYSGPAAGGTTSGGFGNAFSLTPDVWYGANRGTAHVDSSNTLTITSSPSSTPGPVNIKMLFPDGIEVFDPNFFSYGPYVQYNALSGASPDGGAPGQIAGFGMPLDGSGGTLSVGGAPAVITTMQTQYLPFTGSPFPSTFLKFDVPPGVPGWADIRLQTPNGSSTLPKSLFYAANVRDYSSADNFTAILFDAKREQLYLSAGDHIDVFSLASNQFLAPLTPSAQGSSKEFAGLSLTPDSSLLLVSDLFDGSLAVLNPDTPSNSYVIPIAPVDTGDPRCTRGPLYVASLVGNQAFVSIGGIPNIGCGPGGSVYQVDLSARTAAIPSFSQTCPSFGGGYLSSTRDGSKVALGGTGFCIYDALQKTLSGLDTYQLYGAAISGDGNVAASQWIFVDSAAHNIGRVARPDIYYGSYSQDVSSNFFLLQTPKLNDSGSLYYLPYPKVFDIVDVRHGTLRMRFSLQETISNTAAPMAIDSTGRRVFLLTDKGLTIVDLGAAPLSIGSISVAQGTPGMQIQVRGSGFTTGTSAQIGGQAAIVAFVDDETLTITVPVLGSGPADILLTNPSGETYLLQSALLI